MAHDRPCSPVSRTRIAVKPIKYPSATGVSPPPTAPTTGKASSTTIASRISVPAITPRKLFHGSGALRLSGGLSRGITTEQRACGPGGDYRSGDHDAGSAENASPSASGVVDQRGRGFDCGTQVFGGDHPVGSERLLRDQRQRLDIQRTR